MMFKSSKKLSGDIYIYIYIYNYIYNINLLHYSRKVVKVQVIIIDL